MSRAARLWLIVAPLAIAAGAAAAVSILLSKHMDVPGFQAVLTVLTGGSFIVAGLLARTRRPQNRIGLLLIAVGFAWLVGAALLASNRSLAFTLGVALVAIPGGFLIHLLLAYPSGRLQSYRDRVLVVAGYTFVTVGQAANLPVEPDPLNCDECPDNAFLVSGGNETASQIVTLSVSVLASAYLLAVVATIVLRWRGSSPAARRALTPVLLTGGATLLLFAISVGAHSFSRTVSDVAGWTAMIVLIGVPFVFLTGLLKGRLARADISQALAEEPKGVHERIRELLHDPSAELLYPCGEPSEGYVDAEGRRRDAVAEPGRAVIFVERGGRSLAAIVHDEALLDEPELLEQVAAAVGLEIESDKNLYALQASERRNRALLNALPDKMFRLSGDGILLDLQENAFLPPAQLKVGSSVYDSPAPREVIDRLLETGRRALETGELQTVEWEADREGDRWYAEGRFIPSGENEFFVVLRDVTERKQHEVEQEALHRVALAVAAEGRAEQIFDLVAEEIGRVLGAHSTILVRYEPGGLEALVVGGWSKPGARAQPVGKRGPLKGTASEAVLMTRRPIRLELADGNVPPELVQQMRKLEVDSLVAAPIALGGSAWGAVVATLMAPHTFPSGAEERLGAFTRLVSLGLANEEARAELAASRARLVSAGDEERRRLERNLHDGAQQRLVSLSLSLRLAQAKLTSNPEKAKELLTEAKVELDVALEELRELARGIHPAVLTERGLGPALQTLADRAPLPVELELHPERLPRRVEAAAYYIVSEALANVAKYAHASEVTVSVGQDNGSAVVEVADNGIGGADPLLGSGLRGLTDRIEALDGTLVVDSRPGEGTRIHAQIPYDSQTIPAEG
jgi:signal transduction histidine kinase